MNRKVIFIMLFFFSITGIFISSFSDWLFLTLIIHMLWLSITGFNILKSNDRKNKKELLLQRFNKFFIYLLIADIAIIFLSMSFAFRLFLAYLYQPIFYITVLGIVISLVGNYYILIHQVSNEPYSKINKTLIIVASFFYPLGVFFIESKEE